MAMWRGILRVIPACRQSGSQHEVGLSYCRDGTLEATGGGLQGGVAIGGLQLTPDEVAAEVDGQRLKGSWCLHR